MELCSMASHGCLPGPGFVPHPEPGSSRASEDFHNFLPYHGSNQDSVNPLSYLKLQQKAELRSAGGLLDYSRFVKIDSTSKRHRLINFQGTDPESFHFSFGIAEQCARHEKILKLLTSGSIEEEEHDNLLNLALLCDLGPQSLITNFSQQPFASSSPLRQDLIYPTRELYFNEPFLDLEKENRPHGQLKYSFTRAEMNDILSVTSSFHLSKNTNKSSKRPMLVPYFERRRRARGKTDVLNPATEKVGSLKGHDKTKQKTSQKKKTSTKTGKGRDIYSNSYLHACESLLSIIVNEKHETKSTIISLKKSGPQLPEILMQFSATIAGTGIAVVLSVFCRVVCSRVPFCGSKLLSTGLGLGLVWLASAVYKLRATVISISKSCGTSGEREDEMMTHLARNLKDIYFGAAALMVVVVLKVA